MKKFFIISLIFVSVIFVARTSVFAQENPAFRQIASILFQISELIQDIAEEVKEIIKSEPTITPTPAPTPFTSRTTTRVTPQYLAPSPLSSPSASSPSPSPIFIIPTNPTTQTQTISPYFLSKGYQPLKDVKSLLRNSNLTQTVTAGPQVSAVPISPTEVNVALVEGTAAVSPSSPNPPDRLLHIQWDKVSQSPVISTIATEVAFSSTDMQVDSLGNAHFVWTLNCFPMFLPCFPPKYKSSDPSSPIETLPLNLNEMPISIAIDINNDIPFVVLETAKISPLEYFIYLLKRDPLVGWQIVSGQPIYASGSGFSGGISLQIDSNNQAHVIFNDSFSFLWGQTYELIADANNGAIVSNTLISSSLIVLSFIPQPGLNKVSQLAIDSFGNEIVTFPALTSFASPLSNSDIYLYVNLAGGLTGTGFFQPGFQADVMFQSSSAGININALFPVIEYASFTLPVVTNLRLYYLSASGITNIGPLSTGNLNGINIPKSSPSNEVYLAYRRIIGQNEQLDITWTDNFNSTTGTLWNTNTLISYTNPSLGQIKGIVFIDIETNK